MPKQVFKFPHRWHLVFLSQILDDLHKLFTVKHLFLNYISVYVTIGYSLTLVPEVVRENIKYITYEWYKYSCM